MIRPLLLASLALGAAVALRPAAAAVQHRGEPGGFPPSAASLDEDDLDRAVAALVEGLLEAKDPRRLWEPARRPADEAKQTSGWTAIVTLALIEAGISPQDPRLADAVEALASAELDGTYAVAVRAMVWAALPDRHRRRLEADASWLLGGFSGESRGWDYRQNPNSRREDNSITQFASLALWLAASRGVSVPDRLWEMLDARYRATQLADGGWNYEGRGEPRGSMTAAGVATLFMLDREQDPRRRDRERTEEAISKGLAWLDAHFDPDRNPGHVDHPVYWLYSLERAALAGGISRLAKRDWFREGAAALIERLCEPDPDDPTRWRMRLETPRGGTIRLHEHALGLLFLLRGRVPIAIGMLQAPADGPVEGSRLASDLVAWLGETAESEFNWLRIDPTSAVGSWLEPALLWWAPKSLDAWDDEGFWRSMGEYLAAGGLLVAELGSLAPPARELVRSRLADAIPGSKWSEVDDEHLARRSLFDLRGRPPRLERLSNGVRDLVIASFDGGLARGLEAGPVRGVESHRMLANLWLLAVETDQAWPRLHRWKSPDAAPARPATGSELELAVVTWGAGDDPEPSALAAALPELEARVGAPLMLSRRELGSLQGSGDSPASATADLAILRGIEPPTWTTAQWDDLMGYIESGGTLLVETPGGVGAFADAVEAELVRRSGRPAFSLASDPLLAAGDPPSDRSDLRRVTYRPTTARTAGSAISACRLRGWRDASGRLAVVLSGLDLSYALLARPREGVQGYESTSALDLIARVIESSRAVAPDPPAP